MSLVFRVSSYQSLALGDNATKRFASSGTIGRTANNDWILPDPERFVSGQHAAVIVEHDRYFLVDGSANGTSINGGEVPKGTRVELHAGDRLTIGAYEIDVAIEGTAPAAIGVPAPTSAIPENWNETVLPQPTPSGTARPGGRPMAPPPAAPAPHGAAAAKVPPPAAAQGASRGAAAIPNIDEILRVVVEGLMRTLKVRADTKNEFRVAMTTVKPVGNNPLKLSPNVDDALFNLFQRRADGFQAPVDAFKEAFYDLAAHQMAMMAGMRAAYTQLMRRFDPEQLQEVFDKGLKRSGFFGAPTKTRYWELYREMYASFEGGDAGFRRLFGDEFGEAYEKQMSALRGDR